MRFVILWVCGLPRNDDSDAYNFDVRAIKKSCVHIVNKDNKIIPFETMNLFYRDDKSVQLEKLRNEIKF